jgi:hypothetical protein
MTRSEIKFIASLASSYNGIYEYGYDKDNIYYNRYCDEDTIIIKRNNGDNIIFVYPMCKFWVYFKKFHLLNIIENV